MSRFFYCQVYSNVSMLGNRLEFLLSLLFVSENSIEESFLELPEESELTEQESIG